MLLGIVGVSAVVVVVVGIVIYTSLPAALLGCTELASLNSWCMLHDVGARSTAQSAKSHDEHSHQENRHIILGHVSLAPNTLASSYRSSYTSVKICLTNSAVVMLTNQNATNATHTC